MYSRLYIFTLIKIVENTTMTGFLSSTTYHPTWFWEARDTHSCTVYFIPKFALRAPRRELFIYTKYLILIYVSS